MGLGKNTNPRTFLKLKTPKEQKPIFSVIGKDEASGKWVEVKQETSVSGYFTSFKIVDNEYNGKVSKKVLITLTDQGHDYVVDGFLNNVSRGIINNLASVEGGLGFVELSLGLNKSGYSTCYVTANDNNRLDWKLSWEEQKPLIEVIEKKDGSKERDYFDLDKKMIELAEGLKPLETNALDSQGTGYSAPTSELDTHMAAPQITPEEEDDELPF
jgi:hypothetical protein